MKLSKLNKLSFLSLMVGALSAGSIVLTSCDPPTVSESTPESDQQTLENPTDSPATPEPPTANVSPDSDTAEPSVAPKANSDTMKVEVFHADSQCEELISESVRVPESNALEATVGNIIEDTETAEFDIAGYRVNVDDNTGIATVDMSLDPDSQRQFVSLSSCEKLALFGSLNQTLTANEQWNIQEVRFTEKGEEILF
jgi:hypothetical protein